MNFDDVHFSLGFVQWAIMAVIAIYTWMVARASATNKEVMELRERLVALEANIKNMPTEVSVRELIAQLASLKAYQEGNKQQLDTMQHSVNRLNDFLMNRS